MLGKCGDKFVERLTLSVCLDMHAIARVEYPATNPVRHGLAIHKRSHADTLHNARYMDMHMPHVTLLHRNVCCYSPRLCSVAAQVSSPCLTPRRPSRRSASS